MMKICRFKDINPDTSRKWLVIPADWRRPEENVEYSIFWDDRRDFGQIWPRPSSSEIRSFYDIREYYTHESQSAPKREPRSFQQRLLTKLSWLADRGDEPNIDWWSRVLGKKKLDILDIGCGNGSNLKIFEALGHRVVGVEPDPEALNQARNSGHEVYAGTAEALPADVENRTFDVVVFMHVLEHCISPEIAVKNAVRTLRDGGRIVAEVPNNSCLGVKEYGVCWYWLDVPRHLNFFTARSLSALFMASGFDTIEISFRGYCRQFSYAWRNSQSEIAALLRKSGSKHIRTYSYWIYLLKTFASSPSRKYDSVRVVANKE